VILPQVTFGIAVRMAVLSIVASSWWNIPPRSLRSLPPGGRTSRSGRPFPT